VIDNELLILIQNERDEAGLIKYDCKDLGLNQEGDYRKNLSPANMG